MPIPISMDATWLNVSASYNAAELRRADSAMFNGDGTAFGVRGGIVRHGDTSLDISVNASDLVTIQPGAVVIPGNFGVGNGCYRCALDAATTGTLAARNATLPRITLVVFRALDTDVVVGHGAYTGRIEFVDGTPAASPVAPALPSMAVELARLTVPATGGGTATIDKTNCMYSTSAGGRLAVPTFSKLPAADAKWDQAVALDTGVEYVWTGTAWSVKPGTVLVSNQGGGTPAGISVAANTWTSEGANGISSSFVAPGSGSVEVAFGAYLQTGQAGVDQRVGLKISGGLTRDPTSMESILSFGASGTGHRSSIVYHLTGLTPGVSYTLTSAAYSSTLGAIGFIAYRTLLVKAL